LAQGLGQSHDMIMELSAMAISDSLAERAPVDEMRALKITSANDACESSCPPLLRSISFDSTGTTISDPDGNSTSGSDQTASWRYADLGELPPAYTTVRKTFIQIDLPSEAGARRRSLSMPAGISGFSQTDAAENIRFDAARSMPNASKPTMAARPPPPTSAPINLPRIHTGAEVEVVGLTSLPHFNGLVGVVQSFDLDADRYDVMLNQVAGSSNTRRVKVKGANLMLPAPPPPCFSPAFEIATVFDFGHFSDDCTSDDELSVPGTPRWEDENEVLGSVAGFHCPATDLLNVPVPLFMPAVPMPQDDIQVAGTKSLELQSMASVSTTESLGMVLGTCSELPMAPPMFMWDDGTYGEWQCTGSDARWEEEAQCGYGSWQYTDSDYESTTLNLCDLVA